MRPIYKVCGRAEWARAVATGTYLGSVHDLRDGFIHFSTAEQLPGTCAKHFAGAVDQVLLALDPERMGNALRFEESRGGALFPHLYGPLDCNTLLWMRPLPWDGHRHRLPPNPGSVQEPPEVTLGTFGPGELPLLQHWLGLSHVAPYWPDPVFHLANAKNPASQYRHAGIEMDTVPVGYVRWTCCNHERLDSFERPELPENCVDVDVLLGEKAAEGHGVESAALRLMVDRVFADPAVPLISTVAPVANSPSVRAYAKVGFTVHGPFTRPGAAPCQLMTLTRQQRDDATPPVAR